LLPNGAGLARSDSRESRTRISLSLNPGCSLIRHRSPSRLAFTKGPAYDVRAKIEAKNMTFRTLLAVPVALLLPLAAHGAPAAGKKQPAKVTVKKQAWKGYGFLPGYPRSERERRRDAQQREWRYYTWDGRVLYGFGRPGFYGGQYNGGSFGPCWTSTPIGLQWNCGR
jgi:hypothetical protein